MDAALDVPPAIVSILSIGRKDLAHRRDRRRPRRALFRLSLEEAPSGRQVDLFEQNPAGATWGFGVVFSDQALEFLRADDPDTVDAIAPRMESWKNITLNLRGESVEIDGVGFSSIGRLELLTLLQARAARPASRRATRRTVQSVDQFAGYDLIVAADGLNSLVRRSFEKRIRRLGLALDQQIRLVRHDQDLRDAVADLRRRPSAAASTPIIIAIRPT